MRAAQRLQVSLVWLLIHLDHWRSRRNREYRTPRVGRSHFGGGGSGSRSAVPTYPQPPHKWTTSPDSGRTGGSLRASRIASPHLGHRGAVSGSFRTSMLGNQCGSISAHAARQANTAASRAEKLVLGSAPLASHSSETGRRRHRPLSTPTAASAGQTSSPRFRHSSTRSSRNTTESISSRAR